MNCYSSIAFDMKTIKPFNEQSWVLKWKLLLLTVPLFDAVHKIFYLYETLIRTYYTGIFVSLYVLMAWIKCFFMSSFFLIIMQYLQICSFVSMIHCKDSAIVMWRAYMVNYQLLGWAMNTQLSNALYDVFGYLCYWIICFLLIFVIFSLGIFCCH